MNSDPQTLCHFDTGVWGFFAILMNEIWRTVRLGLGSGDFRVCVARIALGYGSVQACGIQSLNIILVGV